MVTYVDQPYRIIEMSDANYKKFKQRVTGNITPSRSKQLRKLGAAWRCAILSHFQYARIAKPSTVIYDTRTEY